MASADATSEGGEEIASLPVTDDLLAEIFLRLPTAADLVHASAVCISFRRLAAARSFVRRFRKLHAAPFLGILDEEKTFHPAAPPHPSAPAASAAALIADFSFSFLPAPARARSWAIQDSRDGRILLDSDEAAVFTEMVVCDPLHRGYLLLPAIPDDLAASVEEEDPSPLEPEFWREVFLVPPGDDEDAEETSFKVIWMGKCKTKVFAFVFSSSTEQWRAIPPAHWNDLFPCLKPSKYTSFCVRQYSYGCFYWGSIYDAESDMLLLDTRRMEFWVVEPPREAKSSYSLATDMVDMVMVEAGEGRPGMFVLTGASTLSYSIRQNDDSGLWQREKTIPLGRGHYLIGSTQRYLLLFKFRSSYHQSCFYSLDIKTFQLQKTCDALLYNAYLKLHAYSNFPPSFLSLPTVASGVKE